MDELVRSPSLWVKPDKGRKSSDTVKLLENPKDLGTNQQGKPCWGQTLEGNNPKYLGDKNGQSAAKR
jgi:hypothetical protein